VESSLPDLGSLRASVSCLRLQTLSTANPGVGGTPPDVPVKKLVEGYDYRAQERGMMMMRGGSFELDSVERFQSKAPSMKRKSTFPVSSMSSARSADVATARVSSPVLSSTGVSASATFLIDRIATIDRCFLLAIRACGLPVVMHCMLDATATTSHTKSPLQC
jgi:hypothetical protein